MENTVHLQTVREHEVKGQNIPDYFQNHSSWVLLMLKRIKEITLFKVKFPLNIRGVSYIILLHCFFFKTHANQLAVSSHAYRYLELKKCKYEHFKLRNVPLPQLLQKFASSSTTEPHAEQNIVSSNQSALWANSWIDRWLIWFFGLCLIFSGLGNFLVDCHI